MNHRKVRQIQALKSGMVSDSRFLHPGFGSPPHVMKTHDTRFIEK